MVVIVIHAKMPICGDTLMTCLKTGGKALVIKQQYAFAILSA
jgi:hypothetical protein